MLDRGWAPSNVSLLPLAGHGDKLVCGRSYIAHTLKVLPMDTQGGSGGSDDLGITSLSS